MMKKSKLLILCVLLTMSTAVVTACGNGRNDNGQAPYEDETNNDVNGRTNGGYNTGENNSMNNGAGTGAHNGGNLRDAGRNLMDSVEDAGGAIMNGVRDITGTNGNNTTNNNGR